MKKIAFAALVLVLLAAGVSAVFTVDRAEFVYLTQFGRHLQTFDGERDAGLHFKLPWPIQSVQRIDHRLQYFDLPTTELPTRDIEGKTVDKMLTIVGYVCWKVSGEKGVDQFVRTVGGPEKARDILGQEIRGRLGAELGNMQLKDLISVASAPVVEERMNRLQNRLMGVAADGAAAPEGLKTLARNAYGIEIVDIRLRRFNYPQEVHSAIYARIQSERNKKVAELTSEGEFRAAGIRSDADREASRILTDARSEEERLKKDADIKAKEILAQAHSKDWQFFFFLENLKNGQNILGASKDVLVLSSKSEIFDFLFKPPRPNGDPATVKPSPGAAITGMPPKKGS